MTEVSDAHNEGLETRWRPGERNPSSSRREFPPGVTSVVVDDVEDMRPSARAVRCGARVGVNRQPAQDLSGKEASVSAKLVHHLAERSGAPAA